MTLPMSTTEYILIVALSGIAILLWSMTVWGGWAESFYERYRESRWPWFWLRVAGVETSRANCVRFARAVSLAGIVLVAIGALAVTQQFLRNAGEANPLLGTWEQIRPDGSRMVWEFTATKMGFTLIDPSGEQAGPQSRTGITYARLGRGALGDRYGIEFTSGGGEPIGGVTVVVTGPDTLLLDFLGEGPFELTRLRP